MSAHQAHVAAIASGKGGAGKTTLAVGLGTAAALAGRQVLEVQFDDVLLCMDLMLALQHQQRAAGGAWASGLLCHCSAGVAYGADVPGGYPFADKRAAPLF